MKMKLFAILLALITLFTCMALADGGTIRLEFENGELLGSAQVNEYWVDGLKRSGDGVVLRFSVDEDAEYDISIIQASLNGTMKNTLLIDDEKIGSAVAESAQFEPYTFKNVYLSAGEHTLAIMRDYGWVRLDAAEISRSPELVQSVYDVEPLLSNPNASEEAKALMVWLCENYGVNIISGQYLNEGEYGRELEAISDVTNGLYPALIGLDMMNYSPASVKLGSYPISVDQAIEYWKQGYIITFCWHWVAPEKYLDTTGNNWWSGYRSGSTTFDISKVMNGEDPEGYELLIRDMDAIAQQLTRLRDAGIPIIWRPLHEASGGWFWWGAHGSEAYIKLYRLMYEKFTYEYELNNLIWLWNGQSKSWYPGDDVVDIIGEDVYPGNHVHTSQSAAFLKCLSYTNANKLIMLSECGCVPSPIACEQDGAMWSAWAVWCYEFVLNDDGVYSELYTNASLLNEFYNQPNVITLKDVPAFGRKLKTFEAESDALSFEFEDGTLEGCAKIASMGDRRWVDISGNAETDGLTLEIYVPTAGEYELSVVQAGIGGYKENYIFIDGEQLESNLTVQGTDWETSACGSILLSQGTHTIRISAFWGWVKLDSLILNPIDASSEILIELEEGELSGDVKLASLGQTRWVELRSNDENEGVSVSFSVPNDGYYTLTIRQAGIGGYKENYLTLDGERIQNTVVQGTDWEECATENVYLSQGEHTLKISCFWGWVKLDWLRVAPEAE